VQTFQPNFWLFLLFAIALVEGQTIITAWESPYEKPGTEPVAMLKDTHYP
jgi:hypothetical protein